MRLPSATRIVTAVVSLTAIVSATPSAVAQSFNIDLDFPGEPPALGGGVPSNTFGAASGQTGVWNSVFITTGPQALLDLSGAATAVNYTVPFSTFGVNMLAFNNPSNTGNFGLLFNDGQQIGTVIQGGTQTYRLSGLVNGLYSIYTYASPPQGTAGDIAISIAGSNEGTLSTSGAMTPNTFTQGVTHVVHTINLVGGVLDIVATDTPGSPPAYVNGFQIVLVPGPGSLSVLLLAPWMMARRRRRSATDITGSGTVSIEDLRAAIGHWGSWKTALR